MTRPAIILVNPQMGENIGFVARAMGNFGFADLRLVNPRDGWPSEVAESTAANAIEIIKQARVYDNFDQAVSDCQYLYATSARLRDFNKECIDVKNLSEDASALNIPVEKIGVVFGGERSGLNNDVVSCVNKIVSIPTNPANPSMNLAMSATLICYELSNFQIKAQRAQDVATHHEMTIMLKHIEEMMDQKNFYKVPEKKEKMLQNIRNIFFRIPNLTSNEVSTLIGILKSK